METIQVAVVDKTGMPPADLEAGVRALGRQVSVNSDFAKAWDICAQLQVVAADDGNQYRDHWGLVLLPASAGGNPLQRGYHTRTRWGQPLAIVNMANVGAGEQWTHTASHELLEMLVDRNVGAFVEGPSGPTGALRLFQREVCDPCQAYDFGYDMDGWHLSDYVLPPWFEQRVRFGAAPNPQAQKAYEDHIKGQKYDYLGRIDGPFKVADGGYADFIEAGEWQRLKPDGTAVPTGHPVTANNQPEASNWGTQP